MNRRLAGFGLAFGIASLLSGILTQARQLSLVLVEHQQGYRTVFHFGIIAGIALSAVLARCALTPLGGWLIGDLHGIDPALTDVVLLAFLWLIPYPFLRGLTRIYIGTLLRIRRSEIPAYGTTAGISLSILAVFTLLPFDFVQRDPILLPVFATYAGVLTELAVVIWGHSRHVRFLPQHNAPSLEMAYVVRFFWPLALIMALQSGTRPLINIFVARAADARARDTARAIIERH